MSAAPDVLILGCGYVGRRVAQRLLDRGAKVTTTTRELPGIEDVRPGMLVVHSVPPAGPPDLVKSLRDLPSRIVYISSTSVYGNAEIVTETTPVEGPSDRLNAEQEVANGPWTSLILRPAAIYGPGRGAHESIKRGTYVTGENYISRIHVDDLAEHVVAGLFSTITGAYPVADEEPCTAKEMAEFCARLLNIPVPQTQAGRPTRNRRVDGTAIRQALKITLKYPSYRQGIPASL
jgi:nucleoside-diphosphate-sugar epimerase